MNRRSLLGTLLGLPFIKPIDSALKRVSINTLYTSSPQYKVFSIGDRAGQLYIEKAFMDRHGVFHWNLDRID